MARFTYLVQSFFKPRDPTASAPSATTTFQADNWADATAQAQRYWKSVGFEPIEHREVNYSR